MFSKKFFKNLTAGLLLTTFLFAPKVKALEISDDNDRDVILHGLISFYQSVLDRNGNGLSDPAETAYYELAFGDDLSLIQTPGLQYDWDPPEGYPTPSVYENTDRIIEYLYEIRYTDHQKFDDLAQNFLDDVGYKEDGTIKAKKFREFFCQKAGFSCDAAREVWEEYHDSGLSVAEFFELFGHIIENTPTDEDGFCILSNEYYIKFLDNKGWTDPYLDPDYKPDEPDEPEDPVDPDEPDPDEPNPDEPDEPDNPVDPDPDEPDEPENPIDPDPNDPDEPVEPEPSSEPIQEPEPEPAPATPSANTDIKRIYTVDQAVTAVKNNKNTFSLKYR